MSYRLAIVGATGNIGGQLTQLLYERCFPVGDVSLLASRGSVGRTVSFGPDRTIPIQALENFDFKDVDLVFFAAGASISQTYIPKAIQQGSFVIDVTPALQIPSGVPLIIPEVNPHDLQHANLPKVRRVNVPQSTVVMMLMALGGVHQAWNINSIIASTYQAVSGYGKKAMDELLSQTRDAFMSAQSPPAHCFEKPIAFNVIPQVGLMHTHGETAEEWSLRAQTQKILGSEIHVMASCVHVPVFVGYGINLYVRCHQPINLSTYRQWIRRQGGLRLYDQSARTQAITPLEVAGEDAVYISRLRADPHDPCALSLWIACDNLRKGTALNAIQIAELLIRGHHDLFL